MNLKRKSLIILIAMLALCFMTAFSACDVGNAHQHTYSDAWTQNAEYHWHKATCGDTDEVSGKAKHTFENGVCSVCGYTENSTPDDPDTPDTPDVPDDPDTPDDPSQTEKKVYDMTNVKFEDDTVTYDGEEHSIFAANLPDGVTVTYEGNGKTAVGVYTVIAHFKGDEANYKPIDDRQATLTIEKATYDMTNVKFEDDTVTYDGDKHSILATNLPQGVTATYDGNETVTAGEHVITAHFKGDSQNYHEIDDRQATLTIEKATYDMNGVVFENETVTYNGEEHSILATNLPQGVTATYDGNEAVTAGEHVITAHFKGDSQNYHEIDDKQATLTIEKATYDMNGVVFQDQSVVYNGEKHSILATNLPQGVTATYDGNEAITAGEHVITAHFKGDSQNYHEIDDKQATLTIEKATYDMNGVVFQDQSVVYNGEKHSILATNLPQGVTATYDGNEAITAGEHVITAHFKGDSQNYHEIDDRQATLTIEKATYDMDSVTFEGLTVPYDGNEHSLKVEGKLPENVNVTYENNGKTAAGDYEVTAHFTGDSQNYEPIPDKKAMLKITKAVVTGITFKDATYPYDGSEHSLKIEGVLPDEVTVRYENNDQTNAGSYQVKAIFDTGNNYEPLSEMTATLTIEKATYDMTKVKFEDDTVTYNGEKHSILATNLPQGVTATYDGNEAITAGEHVITAHFTGDSQNYHEIDDRQATLTIEKATYDMKGVTFESETLPYDGSEHSLKIKGVLPKDVNVTYEGNGKKNAGIYPVKAHFTGDSQNYHEIDDKQATLTIEKLELTVVFIGDSTIKYDGKPHKNYSVRATNLVVGDNVQFNITYSGDMIDMGEYTVRATIEEHENYKLTTGNTLTVTITREKHTVTFKQKNQPDKQFEVLDLAAFDTRQTPVPVEVKGYKVAWEEKDLSCVTQDITVNAVETPISYQIRYYLDNGKNNDFNPENYDITSETIILAAPTKNGYTFLGWFKDSLQGERIREITKGSTGDLNLYAKWEMTEYEITYYLSGGNNHTDNPKTYNITTEYSFGDATRDGYTFEGWYKDAGFHTQITEITQNMTGNLELYAKWKVITYDIHYHLNNGTDNEANPRTYDIETKTITLASPTREYYSFDGWFTENSFRTQIREITLGSFGELNLYAKWTPIDYTINYYLDGGNDSGRNPKTYNVETQTIHLEEATKDHYTFLGWYTSRSGGEKVEQIDLGSHGSRNLYAHWTPTVYGINYFIEGGANSPKNPKDYTVETKTIHLEDPTREYYTFDGWYKDAYYFEQIEEITLGSFGELNLYAKWTPVEFEIRYHLNEGEKNGANNPATYNIESDFTFEKASRLHYTFLGWFTNDALSEPIEGIEVGGHTELDLYAKWAYGTEGLQYSLMGNSQTVTSYTGTDADVVIPDTWEGHPVSNISTRAFNDKSFLTAIVIPDSITMLGMGAFHGCSSLVSMTVPFVGGSKKTSSDPDQQPFGYIFCPTSYSGSMNDYVPSTLKNVTVTGGHISDWAFHYEYKLNITNVILKEGVTAIGKYAFYYQNLESIVIPDSVTSIEKEAFYGCSNLATVEIGDESRLTEIGDWAFYYCGFMNFKIPNGVTSIGENAFDECKNLESIVIPDSVTEIGDSAFSGCSSLATVEIGDESRLTTIGDSAFGGCGFTNFKIPNGVTSIGDGAFGGCHNLESIILPDGVTSIGDWAFSGCENLKYIVIPESLTHVGVEAFRACSMLESVYYKGTMGWGNNGIEQANHYYYSAQPNFDGQHWYYDEHGIPTVW